MPGDEKDYRKIWKEEGVTFYADFEYSMEGYFSRPGLYRMDGEEEE